MKPSEYIKLLFHGGETIAVVLVSSPLRCVGGSAHHQRVVTVQTATTPGFQKWLAEANKNGTNVYLGMNPLRASAAGRTKADIARVKHIYLDIDGGFESALEAVRAAGLAPNFALRTSPDKGQLIWRCFGFDAPLAESTMRALVAKFHGDPAATDVTRILRIPGFLNHKYDPPTLVTCERLTDRIYSPADFPTAAASTVGAERQTHTQKGERRPGDQSAKDFAFACRRLRFGEDPADIAARIAAYRAADKSNPADYGDRTVKAAQRAIFG